MSITHNSVFKFILNHLSQIGEKIFNTENYIICGKVSRITGMTIVAQGINAPIGASCRVFIENTQSVLGEVIGFGNGCTNLMLYGNAEGVKQNTAVCVVDENPKVKVGDAYLNRMLDALGNPIDNQGTIPFTKHYPLIAHPINPLERKRIQEPLDVGVRAINALITVCKGQRLGIFAESGIGKSVLLGMMTQFSQADVVVVGLIGERGREVKEFIEEIIGEKGLEKTVIIASPADTSPLLKVHGALRATALAEYFRDMGKDVLLIVDSITRFAQALREISLSCGEIPTTKGYTPTVFAKLSQLVERSGNGKVGQGSITAFYTVLIDKDDMVDPVGDHLKSLLDGHIVLSRELAESGHYPAIDIDRSISRVMVSVVSDEHFAYALKLKQLYSAYMKNHDLIKIGIYQRGSDYTVDEAVGSWPRIQKFLQQGIQESADYQSSLHELHSIITEQAEKIT